MAVRLDKAWQSPSEVAALGGQLGVFQLADATNRVLYIGFAGGQSRFGLRSAVRDALDSVAEAAAFRVEITTAYRTRYQELLMVHIADHGDLPPANDPEPGLGRLSPQQ